MIITKHLPKCQAIVEDKYDVNDLKKLEKRIIKQKGKDIKIAGFRPGMAPDDKIRKTLEESQEWEQLFSMELQKDFITKWNKENSEKIGGITRIIEIKDKSANPLKLEFKIEYFPNPDMKKLKEKYSKITIKKKGTKDLKVEKEELEKELKELQKKRTMLKPTKEGLDKDKYAFLSITVEGKEVGEGNRNLFHLGENQYGTEFEKKIEGIKEGEERTIEISDLDKKESGFLKQLIASQDSKAGNKVKIKAKAEKVLISKIPELNDEFAKSMGKFNNIEELKKSMRNGMLLEKLHAELNRRREEMLSFLADMVKLEVPPSMVERVAKDNLEQFEKQIEAGQNDPRASEELKKKLESQREKFTKTFTERAERELKIHRILEAIALQEKISATDEEVAGEIGRALRSFPSPQEAEKSLGDARELESRIRRSLAYQKTMRFLGEKNKITNDIEGEIKELEDKIKG